MAENDLPSASGDDHHHQDLVEVKLLIPHDLARAYHRCTWVLVDDGRSRLDSMSEMVRDFLVKHGC